MKTSISPKFMEKDSFTHKKYMPTAAIAAATQTIQGTFLPNKIPAMGTKIIYRVVIKSKNDIIARALLDILSSGKAPAQIRDQIFSVLSHYNTKDLNLDTPIYQPGYTRPLKQCLLMKTNNAASSTSNSSLINLSL